MNTQDPKMEQASILLLTVKTNLGRSELSTTWLITNEIEDWESWQVGVKEVSLAANISLTVFSIRTDKGRDKRKLTAWQW